MPLYEYQCESCGSVFEKIQKFADAPVTVHEECGGHVHRLMSAPSFQFKGTGWYVTDYGKGGKKPESNGESKSGSDAKADSKSESKGESKSEAKSDSTSSSSKSDSSSTTTSTTTATKSSSDK